MPTAISELTGEEVDTWSEAYRHECECRFVLQMPTREARKQYLLDITKRRGTASVAKIEADATTLYWKRVHARNK